jgi:release factor glutamine methyltransferase
MIMSILPQPKTIGAAVAWARQRLNEAGISDAALEASWLLEHVLGRQSHQLVSEADHPISFELWAKAESLVSRRASREPLQYVLGTQPFCGLDIAVTSAVLIPRPETELLVQEVVRTRDTLPQRPTIVDVGTGSGCLAVTLATVFKEARVVAIDRSPEALVVARHNARTHGVQERIEWFEGDLVAPLRVLDLEGKVHIIVSNPPYIAEAEWPHLQPEVQLFEPRMALVGGPMGMELHQRLLEDAREFLAAGGLLLMEVGQGQAPAVREMAERTGGYHDLGIVEDAAGIERVVIVQRLE